MRRRSILTLVAMVATAVAVALPAAGSVVATRSVKIRDDHYAPSSLAIKKNTKVTWRWAGTLDHTVTVTKGPVKFNSKVRSGPNANPFSHTFRTKGKYTIVCTVHGFTMTVKVS